MGENIFRMCSALFAVILFSTAASAALSFNPSPVYLGSVDRGTNLTGTFTITNTGGAVSSLSIASNADSKYHISFAPSSVSSLSAGSSATIAYNITIPTDEPVSNHTLGSIDVSTSGGTSSGAFIANVKGRLKITDVDAAVDGKASNDMQDGQTISQVAYPRSQMNFEISVDNTFKRAMNDIYITNIQAAVVIRDIDDGSDVEQESDNFDLPPGKRKTLNIHFELPIKVDEGPYDVEVIADGRTDQGAVESVKERFTLRLLKHSHDILLTRANLKPGILPCTGGMAKLDITVVNTGSNDEKLAYVIVDSPALHYNAHAAELEMSADRADDTNEQRLNFTINVPSGTPPAQYALESRAYDTNGDIHDYAKNILTVQNCSRQGEIQGSSSQPATAQGTSVSKQKNQSLPIIRETQPSGTSGFTSSPLLIPLVGLAALIVLIGVILIVIKAMKK